MSTTTMTGTDLEPALDELPLFPLPQVSLFPGALMPLHVFEPRYRQMMVDILDGHRSLSIVQVTDEAPDMAGHPGVAEVAGVGTIVEHMELPGGRYNIVVLGRARVRLRELDFVPPYRRARATVLSPTQHQEIDGVEVLALTTAASAFAQLVKARDPDFRLRLPKDATPGALADACAHHLILSGRERQQALEELDIAKRVQLVTEILTVQRASLTMGNASEVN